MKRDLSEFKEALQRVMNEVEEWKKQEKCMQIMVDYPSTTCPPPKYVDRAYYVWDYKGNVFMF